MRLPDPYIREREFEECPWYNFDLGDAYRPNPWVTEEEWAQIEETRATWFREVYDKTFPEGASFMQACAAFDGEVPPKAKEVMSSRDIAEKEAKTQAALDAMSDEDREWFQ